MQHKAIEGHRISSTVGKMLGMRVAYNLTNLAPAMQNSSHQCPVPVPVISTLFMV